MRHFIILLILLVPTILFAAEEKEKGYMGVYTGVVTDLASVDGAPDATGGIQVWDVREDTPAYRGGLRRGDIMIKIGGYVFTEPENEIDAKFKEILAEYEPDDKLPVTILRMVITKKLIANGFDVDPKTYLKDPDGYIEDMPDETDLKLTVHKEWIMKNLIITLGRRNEGKYPGLPEIEDTDLAGMFERPHWEPWVNEVVDRYDIRDEYDDLRKRLRNLHATDDGYRLPLVAAIHRDPFLTESIAHNLTDDFSHSGGGLTTLLTQFTGKHYSWEDPEFSELSLDANEDEFKDWFVLNMTPLVDELNAVFAVFTDEEKEFLMKHRFELTDYFAENVYIHSDEDLDRLERNRRTIKLGGKIDQAKLYKIFDKAFSFITATNHQVFNWMDEHPDVKSIETEWGKIGFGSEGHDWWRDGDFKFIYDPAGDDVYADGTATANSFDKPISWIIDKSGNDAYQSTAENGAQGCGAPGLGFLMDEKGNDTYIGQRWAQGTGFMGVGLCIDVFGDDDYHGTEFVQGAGLYGFGAIMNILGNDEYYGTIHAQGVGFTNGLGMLIDGSGDDKGYSTGKHPTNYGDPGIFDAWSQGVGMGFRGIASGGIGILIDQNGNDKWEAGNFSQGGGYYYGMGIFRSLGDGDDTYIGSRYAQGFCAHQAIGVFIEDGGNDTYLTRQGVNAGLAWDECVTVFIDEGGDDYYNGGTGFSLGASAHNSFMFWLDKGGKDEYHYSAGPARAGGNSYHGGYSLSFFIDQGDEQDLYTSERVENDVELAWPEFGIFRDGAAELKSPLEKPNKEK
jgi:hypothetical protein